MLHRKHILFFSWILILITSCDKGYEVRFRNYYLEPMDSVIIGDNKVVYTNIEVKASTEFKSISQGTYMLKCISKSNKVFESQLEIPKNGSGQRTIQVDGLGTIDVFEE